jgi:hypothetical protein
MSSKNAITNYTLRAHSYEQPGSYSAVPIRSETFDVYMIRERDGIQFLQLQPRLHAEGTSPPKLDGPWTPVVGRVSPGETVVQAATRTLREQVGFLLGETKGFEGMWACAQVLPFFIAELDCIVFSPRFVVRMGPYWEPVLDTIHVAHRWKAFHHTHFADKLVREGIAQQFDTWPGQRVTVEEVMACSPFPKQGQSRYPFIAVGVSATSAIARQ